MCCLRECAVAARPERHPLQAGRRALMPGALGVCGRCDYARRLYLYTAFPLARRFLACTLGFGWLFGTRYVRVPQDKVSAFVQEGAMPSLAVFIVSHQQPRDQQRWQVPQNAHDEAAQTTTRAGCAPLLVASFSAAHVVHSL